MAKRLRQRGGFVTESEKYQRLLEFVKDIVKYWECDPNHAEDLLKELGELN